MPTERTEDYEPLLREPTDDGDKDGHDYPPRGTPSPPLSAAGGLSVRAVLGAPGLVFLAACALALVLSSVNLTVLSAADVFAQYAKTRAPRRRPSVYPGMAGVRWDPPRCRRRTTYPKAYALVDGADVRGRTAVHGPNDKVMLAFGGKQSAHITFYVSDFGLENCTFAFQATLPASRARSDVAPRGYFDSTTTLRVQADSALELYHLPDPASVRGRVLLDRLPLGATFAGAGAREGRVTSRPFWCPNGREMSVQAVCTGDCRIEFGLEGVTDWTMSGMMGNKTAFFIKQYEGMDCIH